MIRLILIVSLLFSAGTALAQESVARSGVVVSTVTDGLGNEAAQTLQGAIPGAWLAPDGQAPRYEIKLMVRARAATACFYVGGSQGTRYQVDVNVRITDLLDSSLVGERTIQGAAPPCRATTNASYTVYGSPNAFEFQRWLFQTMADAEVPDVARVIETNSTVRHMAFAGDGTRLVTGSDYGLSFWDIQTGQALVFYQLDGAITGLDITPDGSTLVTATTNGALDIWDAYTGIRLCGTRLNQAISAVAVLPGGRQALVATDGLYRVNLITGDMLYAYRTDEVTPDAIAISHDGRTMAAIYGNSLRVWEGESEVFTASSTYGGWVDVAFSGDGEQLAAIEANGSLHIWQGATPLASYELGASASQISFSRDGGLVAIVDGSAPLLLDSATGIEVTRLSGHSGVITAAVFSSDGSRIATAATDHTFRVWMIGQ